MALEEEGTYRVTTAEIAFEQAADVERLHPHLILLDFLMYGRLAGWTLLQKLKLYRPTKDIPVVICTAALSDAKEMEPTLIQEGIPIVYKPFDINALLHVVQQVLSFSPHAS